MNDVPPSVLLMRLLAEMSARKDGRTRIEAEIEAMEMLSDPENVAALAYGGILLMMVPGYEPSEIDPDWVRTFASQRRRPPKLEASDAP